MVQTAFEIQAETCTSYLPFPQGIRYFCMPYLETIKALGLRPRAFICFSVFGTPDETLALVFDILLPILPAMRGSKITLLILGMHASSTVAIHA